ncbi:MAG: hypothetical protein U0229_01510 [Anaeromyxobacter sp.]
MREQGRARTLAVAWVVLTVVAAAVVRLSWLAGGNRTAGSVAVWGFLGATPLLAGVGLWRGPGPGWRALFAGILTAWALVAAVALG